MLHSHRKILNRVVATFTNNGVNSGISSYNWSEAVGGVRVGRYNAQFIALPAISVQTQDVHVRCRTMVYALIG